MSAKRRLLAPLCVVAACVADRDIGGADTSSSDGGATADPYTTGTSGTDACEPVDPSTRTDLVIDVGDFPVNSPPEEPTAYRIENAPCTVSVVDIGATLVRTKLACTAPDTSGHTVAIEHAVTNLGEPAWSVGDAVVFSIDDYVWSDLSNERYVNASLRSPQGELLFVGIDTNNNGIDAEIIAPLATEFEMGACGEIEPGGNQRGRLHLALGDATLEVDGGNDGLLQAASRDFGVELGLAETKVDPGHDAWELQVVVVALAR